MTLKRYIALRPETVVSVVRTGKYPEKMPVYLQFQNRHFLLKKTASDSLKELNTNNHQKFVLELEVPFAFENELTYLNPDWIQNIFVYSLQGMKLLTALFNGSCLKSILIQPNLFNIVPPIIIDSSPENKAQVADIYPVSPLLFSTPLQNISLQKIPPVLERLNTCKQHMDLLVFALKNARKNIIISTYSIQPETIRCLDLDYLFHDAVRRSVKIYIYCHTNDSIPDDLLEFLYSLNISIWTTHTDNTILTMDDSLVAAGSFNWLAEIDGEHEPRESASIVYRGEHSLALIEDFRAYAIFESNNPNKTLLSYKIESGEELVYLACLEQHRTFIRNSLKMAKQRVIIFSPFISATREYHADLELTTLREVVERGVNIYFICSSLSIQYSHFNEYLLKINSPKIHLIPLDNFHMNTMIVDNNILAEGSFNWLSEPRAEKNGFQHHKLTLVTHGNIASQFIKDSFECSAVGKALFPEPFGIKSKNSTI